MSAEIASSSVLLELPPEIWLEIFHIATFIPRETDLSATTVEPGLFCSYDFFQAVAFEAVLPLRRTIVLVSRRFYQIGAEVLYTTFHAGTNHGKNLDRRLVRFSGLLVSRPELGRFVKRLSLRWSIGDEERNYRIINRCPNVMIFSSFLHPIDVGRVPWWRRGLPKTIRSFDARVSRVPIKEVLALLERLPHLEILHFWGLQGDSLSHTRVCLSALRILSVSLGIGGEDVGLHVPVLSKIQLPRLTALATNVGAVDAPLSFPLDVWRQLEYFKPQYQSHAGLRSDYFHNLRHLCLTVSSEGVEPYVRCFPFHQLECLTLQAVTIHLDDRDLWKQWIELVVVLPLDIKAMPKLKLFQLEWASHGTDNYKRYLLRHSESGDRSIQYFETLATKFEWRGVLFVETHGRNLNQGFS